MFLTFLVDQAFAVSNDYFKKNKKDKDKHFHLLGGGLNCWTIWQITTIIGIYLGSIIPEKAWFIICYSLNILSFVS